MGRYLGIDFSWGDLVGYVGAEIGLNVHERLKTVDTEDGDEAGEKGGGSYTLPETTISARSRWRC